MQKEDLQNDLGIFETALCLSISKKVCTLKSVYTISMEINFQFVEFIYLQFMYDSMKLKGTLYQLLSRTLLMDQYFNFKKLFQDTSIMHFVAK